ncbi:helix-turn-helix domain-containing protein [Nocardia transvalensis]|uniref:helix-turn-helix domain-containing protein n=1 Tax=Nocardia transvalensis TaxID=37333 RepID=UPI0018935AAB|nr:helix-turn-helix domain-containing protein [Nocardia transvalensis]MBF6333333.1 helix-turn-helix domain-containing protein [Nocardia transvalensis]
MARPKKTDPPRQRGPVRGGGSRPGKVTDADRARIIELHAEGKGRNEIADALGLTPGTITYWARKLELRFDDSQTAEATAARLEQLKRRRLDLAEMIEARIPDLHERLWSPVTTYERGADALIPVTLPLPPLRDLRDGYTALSLALRSLSELVTSQANETVAADRSMLSDLFDRLKAAVEADHQGDDLGEPDQLEDES